MVVDIDRKDLLCMLRGTCPSYEIMNKIPGDLGEYIGEFLDKWYWNFNPGDEEWIFKKYSEQYIWELYQKCK